MNHKYCSNMGLTQIMAVKYTFPKKVAMSG